MFDILTARGERYYPPVMWRTAPGTFEIAGEMNLIHPGEERAFVRDSETFEFLLNHPNAPALSAETGEVCMDLSHK